MVRYIHSYNYVHLKERKSNETKILTKQKSKIESSRRYRNEKKGYQHENSWS